MDRSRLRAAIEVLCPTRSERGKIEGRKEVFRSLQEEFKEMSPASRRRCIRISTRSLSITPFSWPIASIPRVGYLPEAPRLLPRRFEQGHRIDEGNPGVGRRHPSDYRPVDDRERRYCFLFPAMNSSTIVLATSSGYWVGGCFMA